MTTAAEGIRVIDASRHMAGAMVGMVLADNGADVIKLEAPAGDPTRAHDGFKVWNRGKRSLVLDLTDPGRSDDLERLVASADVMVTDWRPGSAAARQVDHATLERINPGLVSVVITGFGEEGPLRDLPGYEHIVAARTGRMASLNGYREGPIFTPVPIASYGAAMLGIQGALAALHQRNTSGRGQRVHASLLQALASYDMVSGFGHRTHEPDPSGRVFGVMPLAFMTARTRDDRFIQMCSRQPHLFRNWLRVVGHEDLLDEPGLENMPDLLAVDQLERVQRLLADAMRTRPADEWLEIFLDEDVGGDPFLSAREYLRHPQATENQRTAAVASPEVGPTLQIGPLALMSGTPSVIGRGEPGLGEHTDEILAELEPASIVPRPQPPAPAPPGWPLAGITVLELGYFFAAPYGMTLLSEYGARVIKVEPPAGDPSRRNTASDYDKSSVGKESIVANLKTPEGLQLVHELAAKADVFLHNFRPGVPERLGVGYDQLSEINPRLVYVYGGAFGSEGPWARRPGFHSSPNAIAGAGVIEAGRDNPPINRTYADPAGALACATAALLGLAGRDRTGKGQYVETTMLSSMGYAVSRWSIQYPGQDDDGPLPDQGQHGFHALHRLYPTSDGWLFLQASTPDQWDRLVELLDTDSLADDRFATASARSANDDALATVIADRLLNAPAEKWERRCQDAGVPAVRADSIDHGRFLLEHEHARANGIAIDATLADGTAFVRSTGGCTFSDSARVIGEPEPLGHSTHAILRELGYGDDRIADLEARGITAAVGHGLD
jgi:crotonobetainyl-CoA:carnitine CoA-transferase CaiB-like acyl-CoA transferase